MKIQCDVCEKEAATLFCSADEAALCHGCDHRIHRANKLAGKHTRYSLLHPTFKESPLCDICQEGKALLFCQEDRAILCRDCDIALHRANEHTKKHSRFLLTGVKLSPSSSSALHHQLQQQPLPPSSTATCGTRRQHSSSPSDGEFVNPNFGPRTGWARPEENSCYQMVAASDDSGGSMSTSSIAEYLMETLPGWRVDEFLDCSHHQGHNNINDSSSTDLQGYCKTSNHSIFPTPDYELGSETSSGSSYATGDLISVLQFVHPSSY